MDNSVPTPVSGKEEEFIKERIRSVIIIDGIERLNDYLSNNLKISLEAHIYTQTKERVNSYIDIELPPPKFMDWLLKRGKRIRHHFVINVKDILVNPPHTDLDRIRIFTIDQDQFKEYMYGR